MSESKQEIVNNQIKPKEKDTELNNLCNKIFNTNYNHWSYKQKNKTTYIFKNENKKCLIEKDYIHDEYYCSYFQLNKTTAKIICSFHGEKNISKNDVKDLRKHLNLISEPDQTNYEKCFEFMLKYVDQHKLKRQDNFILKPHSTIPILYDKWMELNDFLDHIFVDNVNDYIEEIYFKDIKIHKNLLHFLQNQNHRRFLFLKSNKYIFAFNNGYLDIENLNDIKFSSYKQIKNVMTDIYYPVKFEKMVKMEIK